MTNSKLIPAIFIPMVFIAMSGYTYAHWTDSVFKNYRMHVGCVDTEIKTYKVLSPYNDDLIDTWPPDGPTRTLSISAENVFPGWYAWIGFIIQNQGTLPARIHIPTYQVSDPDNVWDWFTHEEYFYGQLIDGESYGWERRDVPRDVYANVKLKPTPGAVLPPPPDNIPPPVYLEAYGPHTLNSMVLWIRLQLRDDYPIPGPFELQIEIIVAATPALD